MKKILFLGLMLSLFTAAYSQKKWETVAYTSLGKLKGRLVRVLDSSLVLQMKRGADTIAFADIDRFRFYRINDGDAGIVVGGLAGAAAGATIGANVLSYEKEGEPAALAGILGGIGGGIIGAVAGGVAGWFAHDHVLAEKLTVVHTPEFYRSLAQQLNPFLTK